MIYRGEIYYGPEKKSLFVVYGTYKNVGRALNMADTYIRMTRKYKYQTCSQLSLWQYWFDYWIVSPYYAVQKWVLRKLGKWNDSGVEEE